MAAEKSHRFDQPVTVSFGGKDIVIEPLRGLARIKAFEQALIQEINALDSRIREHARSQTKVSAEALLETGVDQACLLKLALPDAIDEDLLDESTAKERMGVLTAACYANNLGRLAPFLSLEALIEVATRMNSQLLPEFPLPDSNGSSSEPALTGGASSTT